MGNDNFTAAPSGTFPTKQGLINIAANKQEQFEALCRLVGREDLLRDARFATRAMRKRHRDELSALLEAALAARPATEWEQLCNDAGVPAGRVLSVPEAMRSAQVDHRGLVKTLRHGALDRPLRVTRAGFRIAGADPDVEAPPPALGQHTLAVLTELGYSAAEVDDLRARRVV